MSSIKRSLAALMLVLATAYGAVALVGCGGASSSSAESASAASESAGQDSAAGGSEADGSDSSDEQADCYGDDLPAIKSGQSE